MGSRETNRFTFIPMLTRDETAYQGGKTDYARAKAGVTNTELRNFLEKCLKQKRRSINELERFFKQSTFTPNVTFTIYKGDEYFSDQEREGYFSTIARTLLTRAIILVDPDIGLEVKSLRGRKESHIKYSEVKLLYDKMDKYSVLAVFQFIPRVKRDEYFSKICRKLRDEISGDKPVYFISDSQIVFFVLAKASRSQKLVEKVIEKYGALYNLLRGMN